MNRVLQVLAVAALMVVGVGGGASGQAGDDPVACGLTSTPAELGFVDDIATGADGTVYLVDSRFDEINKFSNDTHVQGTLASAIRDLEVEPAGTLLAVVDEANRSAVIRFEADGTITELVVRTNLEVERLFSVASLPDGSFAVSVVVDGTADHVDIYDAAANLQSQISLPAGQRFPDMVADSTGRVYLSGPSILRIDTTGVIDLELLVPAGDLAVDSADRLYASPGVGDEIAAFEPDGTPLPPIATGVDAGVNGLQVAVDSNDRIIVFGEPRELRQLDGPSDTTAEPLSLVRRLVSSRFTGVANRGERVVGLQGPSEPAVEIGLPGGFREGVIVPDNFGVSSFADVDNPWLALGSRPGEKSVVIDLFRDGVLHTVPAGTTLIAGRGVVANVAEPVTIVVTRGGDIVAVGADGSAAGSPISIGIEDPVAASVDAFTNTVFVVGPAGELVRVDLFARTVEPFPAPGAYPGSPDPVDVAADAGAVWIADQAGGAILGFDATDGLLRWSLTSDDPIWPLTAPYGVTSLGGVVGVLDDATNAYLQFDCGDVTPTPTPIGIEPKFTG